MSKSVFNKEIVDHSREYMFFGAELNAQRFDRYRFPKFNDLTEQMLGFFWRPQEVSLQKDISDFKKLSEHEKFIFTSNLKFQTLLDSIVGRSPFAALLPVVSLPELENAIITWGFFEAAIHSKSYSYIIQNVYPDPTSTFDQIMTTPEIMDRAAWITQFFDDFINSYKEYEVTGKGDLYELKKKLFLCIVGYYVLESIRFYVSFACSFAFGENNLMEGNAKILGLISRDEHLHVSLSTNIVNNWREGKDDPDFVKIYEETRDTVISMFMDTVEQEKAWATYLFKDGSIIGLNETLLHQYVDYMAVRRATALGYKLDIDAPKNNPLPWTQNWLSSSNVQIANQETENDAYLISSINQDIEEDTFKDFEL